MWERRGVLDQTKCESPMVNEENGYKTLCQKSFSPTFVVASDLPLELEPELRVWEVGTRLDVPFEDESGRRGAVPGHSEKLASCLRSGRLMSAREFGMPDYPSVYCVGGGGNLNRGNS
jgi:hypothetical protein